MEIKDAFSELKALLNKIVKEKKDSSIAKGGIGSIILRFSRTLFGLILGILLARELGPEQFGIYSYIFAIITILVIPVQLGLPSLLVKYVAKYEVHDEWDKIKALLRASNFFVIISSLLIVGGSLLLLFIGIINFSGSKLNTFYWGLALLPVMGLNAVRGASLRGLRYIILGLAPDNFIRQLIFVLLLLLTGWWIADGMMTAEMSMSFNFASVLIAYLIGAYWLVKKLPKKIKSVEPNYQIKEWIIIAIPLLLNGGMYIINTKIDVVLLGGLGTAEAVGIYEVSRRGAVLVAFGLQAMNFLLAPYISRFYHSEQLDKLQKVITLSVLINTIIGVIVILIFALYGKFILGLLFGSNYVVGYSVLLILSFGIFLNVIAGSTGTLLNMTGNEKVVLLGMGISAVLNIILNIILIPKLGMEGAATATLVSYFIWNIFLVIMAIRRLNVNPSILSIFKFI